MMSEWKITIEGVPTSKEYFKNLYRYRELFYFFAWRDVLVKYKEAFFGVAWAIMRPLMNIIIFSFLFGRLAKFPSGNANYELFVLTAMLPWQLFATTVSDGGISLISNSQMLTKIYFPRIILPCSVLIVNLLDALIGYLLLFVTLIFSSANLGLNLLLTPLFIFQLLFLCIGSVLWVSGLIVRYRDFRFIIPFMVQFGIFISPIGYSSSIIPESWRLLYSLNPMVGIIDGLRWSTFGIADEFMPYSIALSLCVTFILVITGVQYFRKVERLLADII